MIEIREVLRVWLRGDLGLRPIAELSGCDRKTVRRYVDAAQEAGLVHDGDERRLTDELIGAVVEAVSLTQRARHGPTTAATPGPHARRNMTAPPGGSRMV